MPNITVLYYIKTFKNIVNILKYNLTILIFIGNLFLSF